VLVNIDDGKVNEMKDALAKVASLGSGVSEVDPQMQQVPVKQHQWFWKGDGEWVRDDADQNIQIETAWYERQDVNTELTSLELMGGKGGVFSDSKHKPAAAPGAVHKLDFVSMVQTNVISQFQRKVEQRPSPDLQNIMVSRRRSNPAPSVSSKELEPKVSEAPGTHTDGGGGARDGGGGGGSQGGSGGGRGDGGGGATKLEISFFSSKPDAAAACADYVRTLIDQNCQGNICCD
jgi:hypothetical protein